MKLSIPVLVRQTAGPETSYLARPLFFPSPEVSGNLLERVLARLSSAIRKELSGLAQLPRQERLAGFAYSPNYYEKVFSLELHHKKRSVKGSFLVVVLPDQQPRVAFCPDYPGLWFQFHRGEDLRLRLTQALDNYFQRGPGLSQTAEQVCRSWLSEIELRYRVPEKPVYAEADQGRMILGASVSPGWVELERVGRSLDDLFPHDLNRCLCRGEQARKLELSISRKQRTAQLIVGARKVGKSSLIHEMVRRYRQSKDGPSRRFWLLSPQRLISGMSYVGQWEARLLSILKHAAGKDLVLVLDDLLGLLSAGVGRDSSLCVADVLKPYLQRSEVRVLAESTGEELAVLRERDRGFADLFSVTHLQQTLDQETLEICLEEIRIGERLHGCTFQVEALTTALELQGRYIRDAVFPGKAATFLRQLAARNRSGRVDRQSVLSYFNTLSGIDLRLLEDRTVLKREEVLSELSELVIGQSAALEAAADAIMMAKARLADPSRPLASLLFVGPTGVGKTECAKALARFLFQENCGLVRFDMNEFVNPGSATRLFGTFLQPDGLLTAAVRRRPFCVLLLDEIEKAHHEVFNLLLQLLGDGRLTDARGRTVDFTQTMVVMTSNLGVSNASKPMGFRSKDGEEELTYLRAVEQFFPPELFNRLDRVVPFHRLSRNETQLLGQRHLAKLLAREGLVRRQCLLRVDPSALESIADLGFHPQLGARALKRSLEKLISIPVAARLSEMKPHSPTVISIQADPDLQVRVRELAAPRGHQRPKVEELNASYLTRVETYLQARQEALQHEDGLFEEGLSSSQLWHFAVQDRLRRARAILGRLSNLVGGKAAKRRLDTPHILLQAANWQSLLESPSLGQALKRLSANLPVRTEERRLHAKFAELLAEIALLEGEGDDEEALLHLLFTPTDAGRAWGSYLLEQYRSVFSNLELRSESTLTQEGATIKLMGPQAGLLARFEQGLHLTIDDEGLGLVEVLGCDAVTRIYDRRFGCIDLRSGWMCQRLPDQAEFELLVLCGLPSPLERLR